jgi:large subunit ribosomal protein L25
MEQPKLTAHVRKTQGKEAARRLRRQNQIPAVFYGPHSNPVQLVVEVADLKKILRETSSENIFLELRIESNGSSDSHTVILKELQVHPVKPVYYHADFYEIPMDKEVSFQIPIHLTNTPAGVSKGGILEQALRELTVTCLPSKLVDRLDLDVSGLDVGQSLHIRDIHLPEGIRTAMDGAQTVAAVNLPVVKEAKAEEGEVAEEKAEEAAPETAEEKK